MSELSDAAVAHHMRLVRALSREGEPLSSGGPTATVRNPRWYTPEGRATPRRESLREELVARALAGSAPTAASPAANRAVPIAAPEGTAPPTRPSAAVAGPGAGTSATAAAEPVDTLVSQLGGDGDRPRAVVMAGPPGAGKSTVRAQLLGADAAAWMVIDADAFKDALTDQALRDGSYEGWLKPAAVRQLEAGGERFFPLEMSALLQAESGQLAELQRAQAMAAGRDIVIDTVLWNAARAQQMGAQLEAAGYAISVVDVEVPYELSVARVAARWEATYREAMAGRDQRGGRWVPSEYARVVYGGPGGTRGPSLCESSARDLAERCEAVVSYHRFRAHPARGADITAMLATPARLEVVMQRSRAGAPLLVASPQEQQPGASVGPRVGQGPAPSSWDARAASRDVHRPGLAPAAQDSQAPGPRGSEVEPAPSQATPPSAHQERRHDVEEDMEP